MLEGALVLGGQRWQSSTKLGRGWPRALSALLPGGANRARRGRLGRNARRSSSARVLSVGSPLSSQPMGYNTERPRMRL